MTTLAHEIDGAAVKAIKALAGYRFAMFGYWAGIWVHLNRVEGKKRPSPFKFLVQAARELSVDQGGRAAAVDSTQDRGGPAMIPYEPDPPELNPDWIHGELVDVDLSDGKIQYSLSPKTVTRIVDQAIEQVRQSGRASIALVQLGRPNDFSVVWSLVIDSGEIKIRLVATGDLVDRENVEYVMTNDVNWETCRYRVGGGL